jgi:hypothetical protein
MFFGEGRERVEKGEGTTKLERPWLVIKLKLEMFFLVMSPKDVPVHKTHVPLEALDPFILYSYYPLF